MNKESNHDETSFLFNVDVLVKGRSNAAALQILLKLLTQNEQVADCRIHSGIELGNLIDAALQLKKQQSDNRSASDTAIEGKKYPKLEQIKIAHSKSVNHHKNNPTVKQQKPTDAQEPGMYDWIERYIKGNTLVRLIVNRYGGQRSIPCRILNLDKENTLLSVYHVDEKQVYSFKMNEIDEIST